MSGPIEGAPGPLTDDRRTRADDLSKGGKEVHDMDPNAQFRIEKAFFAALQR
jgi:hypothetical protein